MQKSILKVALLAVLSVVLVLGLSTVALAAPPWSDLPDTVTAGYGVTNDEVATISEGYPGGLWKPYQNITRAQFVKMAVAAFDIPLVTATSPSYADVPVDDLYSPSVEAARAAGIIDPAPNFNPGNPITRQQALAIISRYQADANGHDLATMYSTDEIAALLANFGDMDSISSVFKEEMAFAYEFGITVGDASGNLNPLANLTRIQGAAMLIRAGATGDVTWTTDGSTKITDASFDKYFEGTALEGVEALLDAGKVYVNGMKVPATESETTLYSTNSIDALWWNAAQSTWGFAVHKYVFNYGPVPPPNLFGVTYSPLTFDAARLSLVENLSMRRGRTVKLTIDPATGEATQLDLVEWETVYVGGIETHGSTTTIDRSEYTLETDRYPIRFDVNGVFFPTENADSSVGVGDFAVWWLGPTGWNLQRAVPVVGLLTKDADKYYHINGTDVRYEADCSRFNLATSVRPTQFYTAYTRLGLTGLDVTVWCMPDSGNPIGFTYGSNANSKSALALAIANAEAAKVGVVVATNGADVDLGVKWVTQATMDDFDAAIATAQTAYDDPASVAIDYTAAIYALSIAYGATGATPPGFIGSQGTGTK